jgi:hypothetical protein
MGSLLADCGWTGGLGLWVNIPNLEVKPQGKGKGIDMIQVPRELQERFEEALESGPIRRESRPAYRKWLRSAAFGMPGAAGPLFQSRRHARDRSRRQGAEGPDSAASGAGAPGDSPTDGCGAEVA